jgi:hypothetical protein
MFRQKSLIFYRTFLERTFPGQKFFRILKIFYFYQKNFKNATFKIKKLILKIDLFVIYVA